MSEGDPTQAQDFRDLVRAVRALEERVRRLEAPMEPAAGAEATPAPPQAAAPQAPAPPVRAPVGVALQRVPALVGRLLLVLGGAYLLRALTEGQQLDRAAGAGLGYVYGLASVAFAHRAGVRKDLIGATWHGLGATLITVPLIWETSARFEILSFEVAAAMLAVAALLVLAVSWRHDLGILAGIFTAAAGACAVVTLLPNASAALPLNAALLVIGMASLWVGWSRGWMAPPWFGGLAAVAGGFLLAYRTLTGTGPAPEYAIALLLLLFLLYAGSFVAAALRGWQRLDGFAATQTALTLLVGFGGASRIVQQIGAGQAVLGFASLAAAVATYLLAFSVLDRERRRCFLYLTSLAVILVLASSALLLEHPAIPWSLLSVATLFMGRRLGRATLGVHAVAYATAALLASGLLAGTVGAWTTPASPLPHALEAWLAFGALAAVALWPLSSQRSESALWSRGAHGTALVLLLVTLGGLLLRTAVASLPSWLQGDAGLPWQSAVRTAVIAGLAVGAALASRRASWHLLARLVPAVLAIGAVKLVLEDLPGGQPATLALSFGAYGAALILAPRILRARSPGRDASAPRSS